MAKSGSGGGEKTEKPTPKKLKDARKEGQVARTAELGGWAAMLIAGLALGWGIQRIGESVRALLVQAMAVVRDPRTSDATSLLREGLISAVLVSVVLGSVVLLVSVAAAGAQGGIHLATKAAKPQWSRLSIIKGAKRIFGPQAAWEALKTCLKTAAVGLIVWRTVDGLLPALGGLVPIDAALSIAVDAITGLIRDVALLGLLLAGADYAVIRRRTGKQLRMSKQEVKEEHRQTEGDPFVRGAMRARARAAARSRMMADIPLADVVVTNPTHVAVALRYQPERGAPTVVAKGMGAVARRIREVAEEHRIPSVEDVPLARALHASCEVGSEVPAVLFEAVAQVLAFVLTLAARGHASGHHRSPRADLTLPNLPPSVARRIPGNPSAPV